MEKRVSRRLVGALRARLPDLGAKRVPDPRRKASVSRPLPQILNACIVGMTAGAKSLSDVEALTADMAQPALAALGLGGRLPDTTARDTLTKLDPLDIRCMLHRTIRAAARRKAIEPDGLPAGIVSMDGKATAIDAWDDKYAQKQTHSAGAGAHGVVRTVTSCLISSPACPAIDAYPIPSETNEMGIFPKALDALLEAYGSTHLVRIVLYDAGACSQANGSHTRSRGLHYAFRLNANQPTLFAEAVSVLGKKPLADADDTSEHPRNGGVWRRHVFLTEELAGWLDWGHLKTVVRVASEQIDKDGKTVFLEDHYYVSSLPLARFSPAQWNLLLRRRWAVENECHHTFDTVFGEDEHPWLITSPVGMLVVTLLRRIAYTLVAFFRSVTLRSEATRATPWRRLLEQFRNALTAATPEAVAGLRTRALPAAPLS